MAAERIIRHKPLTPESAVSLEPLQIQDFLMPNLV